MRENLADLYFKPSLTVKLMAWTFLVINFYNWEVEAEDLGFPSVIKYVCTLSSVAIYAYAIYKRPVKLGYYGPAAILVILFAVYSMYMIVQSFRTDTRYFQFVFGAKYYLLPWLFPVLMLFVRFDAVFLRYLMKFSLRMMPYSILCMLLILAFLNQERWIQHFYGLWIFDIAGILIVLVFFYVQRNKRDAYVFGFYYLFTAFLAAYYGRRGVLLTLSELLLFFIYLRLNNPLIKVRKKAQTITYSVLLVAAMIGAVIVFSSKLMLVERGIGADAWDESRGRVVDDFFADFISGQDWLWGRGIDGRILRTIDMDNGGMGDTIENGFLYTLLKGGGVYLGLQMLIFLISAYLAWFRTRNHFSKAFTAVIITHIFGMVSYNLPVFSISYILVWLAVIMGYSAEFRNLTNKQILAIFKTL